ncbi:putative transferase CAF17 homolog, mitochondrial isoform X2 [Diachasmimorpha longicaudata]
MRHFTEGVPNMYSLFLNTKGRVLYDTIIYKSPVEEVYLLEVDASITTDLQRHLKMYKIRKKVEITSLGESMKVWAAFVTDFDPENMKNLEKSKLEGRILPCGPLKGGQGEVMDNVMMFKDPRIPSLGMRVLGDESVSGEEIARRLGLERNGERELVKRRVLEKLGIEDGGDISEDEILEKLGLKGVKDDENVLNQEIFKTLGLDLKIRDDETISKQEILKKLGFGDEEMNYREFRYRLGIGEGMQDLPPGKAFPLEVNCDYLHGVSFHKGCYIGQELTARTHHTGVVRKRLMPLVFEGTPAGRIEVDENILDGGGKAVGKLKGIQGKFGLGLMRIAEAVGGGELRVGGIGVKVVKPCWWPVDSPKEKMSVN